MIVGNSGTPFRKVSAIYCNYGNYSLINLTSFHTYYLLLVFTYFNLFTVKRIRNNTVEASFGILGVSNEPKNYLKANPIVESDIGFLLESDWYSSD